MKKARTKKPYALVVRDQLTQNVNVVHTQPIVPTADPKPLKDGESVTSSTWDGAFRGESRQKALIAMIQITLGEDEVRKTIGKEITAEFFEALKKAAAQTYKAWPNEFHAAMLAYQKAQFKQG